MDGELKIYWHIGTANRYTVHRARSLAIGPSAAAEAIDRSYRRSHIQRTSSLYPPTDAEI